MKSKKKDETLRVVKPFGPSPHHGLDQSDVDRMIELKRETLGYAECLYCSVFNDGRTDSGDFEIDHFYIAHIGSVKNELDAQKLIACLNKKFPGVPFRMEEEMEFLLKNVIWKGYDELLGDQDFIHNDILKSALKAERLKLKQGT